ncbi:WD40/YVTN/BNR-like repeat-containing protein, partial [Singulisphaera rosea]
MPLAVREAWFWGVFVLVAQLGVIPPAGAQWAVSHAVTDVRLRGLGVVDADTVWASGGRGTFLRTVDGGLHWTTEVVPGASSLDFRDLHAWDSDNACLLSIGPGESSRIYRTDDGGKRWSLSYKNTDPKGFLDALAFWDEEHGLALGDPVDGRFTILATDDGGKSWQCLSSEGVPPALPGEGAFAASGTCLVVGGRQLA